MTQPGEREQVESPKECEVLLLDDTTWAKGAEELFSPENPDPSVARVAISNSREVCSPGDLSPVT